MKFLIVRKILLYIIFFFFMVIGIFGARFTIPLIVSYFNHWSMILLVEAFGLLLLFTGLKLISHTNRVWSQRLSIMNRDGVLALACVFLIGFGGAWTAMSAVNLLGGILYLVLKNF